MAFHELCVGSLCHEFPTSIFQALNMVEFYLVQSVLASIFKGVFNKAEQFIREFVSKTVPTVSFYKKTFNYVDTVRSRGSLKQLLNKLIALEKGFFFSPYWKCCPEWLSIARDFSILPYLYKELITVRVLLWTVSFDVLQLCLLS
jgi:hypothetical protein